MLASLQDFGVVTNRLLLRDMTTARVCSLSETSNSSQSRHFVIEAGH